MGIIGNTGTMGIGSNPTAWGKQHMVPESTMVVVIHNLLWLVKIGDRDRRTTGTPPVGFFGRKIVIQVLTYRSTERNLMQVRMTNDESRLPPSGIFWKKKL